MILASRLPDLAAASRLGKVTSFDPSVDAATIAMVERYDLVYRSVVAIMFNFTQSGHPGGSVSSGRIVAHSCCRRWTTTSEIPTGMTLSTSSRMRRAWRSDRRVTLAAR